VIRSSILALLVVAACGNGKVDIKTDAFVERPVIDPTPYMTTCSAATPCAAPYECTVPDLAHDPLSNLCMVPCMSNAECPEGQICNGQTQTIEDGASNHCIIVP
jgi:hypothetical protein